MDTLTKWFDEWHAKNPEGTTFQAFQAGVTEGAVSMRARAQEAVQKIATGKGKINDAINNVGKLPDIPQE